ncbi:MAG: hypothetical protein Q8M07_30355, partial [Prosthecobacter sp.]|nr:hypothetical protein [Prosthecobacter sp.]
MKGKPSRKSDNTATQKKQETHIPEAFSLSTDDAPTPPPYRLPDDPYPPSRPRTDVELLLIYEMHHSAVAKPDRSFATNEDRTKDQLSLAQQAMTDLWKWIASHADNGNFEAQCIIFQIAENLTSGFLGGVKNKLPGIMHYAHGRVAMPG